MSDANPIQSENKDQSFSLYKPSWLQRLGLFSVGASHEPHYTNRDVRSIITPGLMIAAVAPFMGVAAALLVTTFGGLAAGPLALGVGLGAGVFWAGMVGVIDRTLISSEARAKAIDGAKSIAKGDKPHRLFSTGLFMKRLPAFALRLALAAASSFVVSETIVTTVLYKSDIEKVLDNRFKAANHDLIAYNEGLRKAYDAKTDALSTDLVAQKQRQVQQQDTFRIADVPVEFDRSLYDTKLRSLSGQEEALQQQLVQAQASQSQFQAAAQAEELGARIGSASTGHAGKGAAYNAAMIQFQQASQSVDAIKTQIATINTSIETVRSDMTAAMHEQDSSFHVKTQNLDQNVQALTASVTQLTQQIHDRVADRDDYFRTIKEAMEHDPKFVPHEQGLLNSLSARDELLKMDENTGSPRNMAIALWVLLGMVEMSPILAAAMRSSTKSELKSAVDDLMSEMKMTADLSDIKTALHVQLTQNGLMAATSDELEKQAKPKAPTGETIKRFEQVQSNFMVDAGVRQTQRLQHALG